MISLLLTGWFLLKPDDGKVGAGMVNTRSGMCVRALQSAKYLPENLNVHMVAYATCTAGPAASAEGTNLNPIPVPKPAPMPVPPTPEPVPVSPPATDGASLRCEAAHKCPSHPGDVYLQMR